MGLELRLTSWQNHREIILRTSRPVTIIAGPNASGKTALLDGVEFVFLGTGKLRGITTKRDLADLSIHDDAKETGVDLSIPAISFDLTRAMGRDANQAVVVNGTGYKVTKADAKIREKLGIEPERVRAALEADHVLTGDESRRRWIFFKATGTSATLAELLEPLKEAGLSHEDARKIADEVLKDGFPAGRTIAEAKRVAAGRTSKTAEAETPSPLFVPPWAEDGQTMNLSEVTVEELGDREGKLESAISAADKIEGFDRGRLEAELSAAKGRRSALFAERDRAQTVPEEHETAAARFEEASLALETLDGEIGNVRGKVARYKAEADLIVKGKVDKPERCPVIAGGPECPMSKTKLTAHRKGLDRRLDELTRLLENEESALPGLEERRGQAVVTKGEAETDVDDKRQREERLEELGGEIEGAETKVTTAETAVRDATEPDGEATASAATLRERLENLREVTEAKRRYDSAAEAAQAAAGTRRDADTERTAWDRAAKLLAPDGLPSRLFAARASELQSYADELPLEAPIRLTAAAELEAKVGGRWRRRAQLSESWRIRLSIVASHTLARAARFPLLIVDKFDHLDPVGRVTALNSLRGVAPHYPGGVLILSTLNRPDPQPTGLPDVETFVFGEDGLERIG